MEADSAMRQQSQELRQIRVTTAELKASSLCSHSEFTPNWKQEGDPAVQFCGKMLTQLVN